MISSTWFFHSAQLSIVLNSLMSPTKIAPDEFLQNYRLTAAIEVSIPTKSQIWSLISFLLICKILVLKSAAIVAACYVLKWSPMNLWRIDVLPTLELPTIMTLNIFNNSFIIKQIMEDSGFSLIDDDGELNSDQEVREQSQLSKFKQLIHTISNSDDT